jgi:methyl-accepting chemotaxis protein
VNQLMPLMRNFSIRLRMRGAIGVVLALFALVGLTALVGGRHLAALNDEFMHHSVKELHNVGAIRESLSQIRVHERNMLIDHADGAAVRAHRAKWTAEIAQLKSSLNGLLEGEEDEDNPLARAALLDIAAYAKGTGEVLTQIEAGAIDSAGAADKLLAGAKEQVAKVETGAAKIAIIIDAEAVATQGEFNAEMRQVAWVFAAMLGLVVLVVVPLTLLNSASIIQPMEHARDIALAISGGDLTRRVQVQGQDEAAELLRALDKMQIGLSQLVGQVRDASETIHATSTEVASGNSDLSARTEQAASSLQQTASSMEQLTSIVRHSAEAASQANGMASAACGVAQRGGEVVAQVVTTMDEINAASRRIADIISVIDGIAFQTNILALNAAVEAARAGEQGRGFAVVAGEVRSLAGRSAEAAREIKTLIGASVDKVDNGARLVGEAGSTMNEIVASVQRVTDIMGEISQAATEQSQGIGQVNSAVNDLDRMTQQNAALVEESAAAAEHLKAQANGLASVVETFRIDRQAGAVR